MEDKTERHFIDETQCERETPGNIDAFINGTDDLRSHVNNWDSDFHSSEKRGDWKFYDRSQDELCGLGSWKPDFLQHFANISVFTGLYSIAGLVTQSLSIYVNSQIPSLEKQFRLTSIESGFLMSCNDIGFMICTLFVSAFAQFVHIPKALSLGLLLYGISGLICVIPNFIQNLSMYDIFLKDSDSNIDVDKSSLSAIQLCFTNSSGTGNGMQGNCSAQTGDRLNMDVYSYKEAAITIIAVGMMLQGMGKAPRGPFLTVYVDDSVDKRKTGYYIGIIISFGIFGPALSYGFGGIFSKMYLTLKDVKITPKDPRWIGAWWLGFLVFGIFSILVSVPIWLFPRRLYYKHRPRLNNEEETNKPRFTFKERAKERALSYWRIVRTPVYCLFVCTNCSQVLAANFYIAFLSKYVKTQFGIPLWKANFTIAATMLCSTSLGFYLGGLVTKKIRMTPINTLRSLLVLFVIQISLFIIAFFLGCEQPHIIGYERTDVYHNCSLDCSCDHSAFFPVCGSDGQNYYSPCYAGCIEMDISGSNYNNCTCISTGKATAGLCETNCPMLYPWAVFAFASNLFGAMKGMFSYIGKIRSVEDRDKSTAIGLQTFMMALIAFMPGPLIAGKVVDTTCLIWETTCSSRGACALYDIVDFRVKLHGFSLLFRVLAMCSTITGLIIVRKWKDWPHLKLYTKENEDIVTNKEDRTTHEVSQDNELDEINTTKINEMNLNFHSEKLN